MEKRDIWPTVHAERKALAADLASIDTQSWSTTSLATEWTVRDVLAHMTATAKITPGSFFPKLLASGFSLGRMQTKDIAAARGATPMDTLTAFEAVQTSVKHPPGPADTMLGETLIHAEDIRRPLGIRHDYPVEAAVRVADFYKNSNLIIGAKRRITGLSLRATDTDWSHGQGPEVSGPIMALVMAMTGRKAVLGELSGDGVPALRDRA
ncbi:MAG TPA: maleylpyruvate isomerase family mycothiol-dependent enzyme [Acidimicrobiales bacterium]|nr:maleylpyruvate isomerase family mycothiol-dependent enzyme [Acidimicrobiales bacterium]